MTNETYQERINQALDFIEENLCGKLILDDIAAVACYSKYHFTRVFAAITGNTVGEYVRKRRLSESTNDLLKTKGSILQIAQKYQFDSQEAYTRAFRAVFEVSPGKYRKLAHKFVPFERYRLSTSILEKLENSIAMTPEIVEHPERKLVGMKRKMSVKADETVALWQSFMPRRGEVLGNKHTGYFSIQTYEEEMSYEAFTEEIQFEKWAAVEVDDFDQVPQGMETRVLKAGKFAVFTHKGPAHTFKQTIDYIYGVWLPQSGFELDERDAFALMGDKYYGPNHPESEEEFWVPIR